MPGPPSTPTPVSRPLSRRRRRALSIAAAAWLVASGCEEPTRSMTSGPAMPAPIQRRVDEASEQLEPPPSAAWPSEVRSLRESVEAFESSEACLAELRARTPTAVAEGLADLAYDGFFDDVCRGLGAVKAADVAGCDAIEVSTVRAGCRRRLAILHASPDACPADRVYPGREAVCVAWASRDPELCRAAPLAQRARCLAVLAEDPSGCARLRAGDRDRCEAEVRRYASALGDERHGSPAASRDPVFELEVREVEASGEPLRIERDVLARGVRLVPQGCRWQIELAEPLGEPALPTSPGRFEPTFLLELSVPAPTALPRELPLNATDAVLSLATPAHGGSTSIAGASGGVTLTALEPTRGGALEGTIRGRLRRGDAQLSVVGRFATFVRDLEPMPASCEAPAGPADQGP